MFPTKFASRRPRLTLFGRSLLLVVAEILANVICWVVAGVLFGRNRDTQPILSLALLAWTLGLRHALDADHISAIDNATRGLISLGQLPVTCGLFFSLGHSTIVVVVNVAIAISSDVYEKIQGVGTVGGIVGAAVSGSFLFIVGLANSIILWKIVKRRRLDKKRRAQRLAAGEDYVEDPEDTRNDSKHTHTIMMRIIGPVITFVDKPWKMYPVGVLFGFGFDTASSIALIAISALGKKGADGSRVPGAHIVILPLLFTAGMTLIDSMDSILMLYSYAGFPDRSMSLFEKRRPTEDVEQSNDGVAIVAAVPATATPDDAGSTHKIPAGRENAATSVLGGEVARSDSPKSVRSQAHLADVKDGFEDKQARDTRVKMNMMSGLSIILTLMSILVAFSISLITIMGLIGDNCTKCQEAAEAEDGGGLAGSWWRGWSNANENSGYIGAAIVGSFVLIVGGWYGWRWCGRRITGRSVRVETR